MPSNDCQTYREERRLVFILVGIWYQCTVVCANPDAKRLYEDLLTGYNKLIRPVDNNTNKLDVYFRLKLSQLLDVHEKNQIMTTNVWLEQRWTDFKLMWDPKMYGGIGVFYVPSHLIWLPDIVLYNNADGNYQVTIMTKAKVFSNGTVVWTPPAVYKSMCQIDVEWFPYDVQKCEMKFGSWTYGGLEVDLKHMELGIVMREDWELYPGADESLREKIWVVDEGVDLQEFYSSVEWDIMRGPGIRHEKRYPCCDAPFIDITYYFYLRRKTLFYTVNLILPSIGISFLTALVFYLPSDSGEKMSLCISILIALTVFFLLLVEIIPSTSLVIPLIGKYLLFTMVLVAVSVIATVLTLNMHHRSSTTHVMSPWIKRLFLDILPRVLLMKRPVRLEIVRRKQSYGIFPSLSRQSTNPDHIAERKAKELSLPKLRGVGPIIWIDGVADGARLAKSTLPPERIALEHLCYIADQMQEGTAEQAQTHDWKFVAQVMDRIFLIAFTLTCAVGTFSIVLRAPTLYDQQVAIA